jgi:hypothetical protein
MTIYGTVRSFGGIQKELRSVAHNIPVGRYVWERIPSLDELNQMVLQKSVIGSFAEGYYWSSSEANTPWWGPLYYAWGEYFFSSSQNFFAKLISSNVRAVRAF